MIKKNPELTDNLEKSVIQLRGDIEAARELGTLKEDPRWDRIRTILESQIALCELKLDSFETLTDKYRDLYLKERKDFKYVIGLVDDAAFTVELLNKQLQEQEAKFNERTSKRESLVPSK